jgi:NADPH:quinone reductase-like Zn-dependent oxidoreductase
MAPERQQTVTGGKVALPVPQGSMMRAIVQDGYGSADTFRLAQIAQPVPGAGEVLLHVHAAGLDRGQWHLMKGQPYLLRLFAGFRGPRNPVPGIDVAGTVVAVGQGVTRFSAGDEVFGFGRGTFAEYAIAREDKLARKPVNASLEQAAVVPVSAVTALLALTDVGHVRQGQDVLITGASGGVGSYAVQLAAAAFGAEVTGVCSAAKTDLVRSLGAAHVMDYTQYDFAAGPRRYDLIIDIAGNPTLSQLRRALTPAGTAVITGGEASGNWTGMGRQLRALALSPFLRQRLTMVTPRQRSADLERLTALIEAGTVTPSIGATYPLAQLAEAMRHLESGQARGKIVITI